MILLLVLAARAASPPEPAAAPRERGLLVCPDPESCAGDAGWLERAGGGGPGGFEALDFERVFAVGAVPDGLAGREAFEQSLHQARDAWEKGRHAAVMEATQAGIEALSAWRGPVKTQQLFDLYYLRGAAAVELGRDRSQAFSFRQAAAIANGQDFARPAGSRAVDQAWLDESRKAVVTGRGELVLGGGPSGTAWKVNGRSVPAGTVVLLPGLHRVSATAPGQVRSWTVDVPVLPGRTSRVEPDFASYEEQAAVHAALARAIDELQAPEALQDLLVAWCEANGVQELRLMRLVEATEPLAVRPILIGPAPPDRPAAAAGEALNLGDGLPTTFEAEVLARHLAQDEQSVRRTVRLRMAWFDPQTRRLRAEPAVSSALRPSPERLRLGIRTQFSRALGRSHLGLGLGLGVPMRGPLGADVRLGFVRADRPYNLYEDWTDHQLLDLVVGARLTRPGAVGPFLGLGAQVLAPVAVGGRLSAGMDLRVVEHWQAELELAGTLYDKGGQVSGGLGLLRRF